MSRNGSITAASNATTPLSIGIVVGSASRLAGGLFNSVRRSAFALSAAGHNISVLALDDGHLEEDAGSWAPLNLLTFKRRGPTGFGYAPAIGPALRAGSFDVVHQHGIWQFFSTQVSAWRRKTGKPVMISPRGMLDSWALRNSGWKKRLAGGIYERQNLTEARCLHALNVSEAKAMRAYGLTNPIAIIPNGADIPLEIDVALPAWWPVGKVLLFMGRIHPKKGVTELVDAFARFRARAPHVASDWRLVIAGWDDNGYEMVLRAVIDRLGLNREIVLPGALFDAEKDAALRHASAFILPSHSEGLPMSVLEAWSYRLPVLMTDACNLPEGFALGAAARITAAPASLAEELEQLLAPAKAPVLARMGENGLSLLELRFVWREIAERHAEVYRWMAGIVSEPPSCVIFK